MGIDPSAGLADSEILSYNTVRIEFENYDGQIGMGTGFLYQFRSSEGKNLHALITNRHVLENVQNLTLMFNQMGKDNKIDPSNKDKIILEVTELDNNWHGHPNSHIDLAFLQLDSYISKLNKSKTTPIWFYLRRENFPLSSEWSRLTALEPIVTVGYPNDIWDSVNNLPILRRGVTATHPKYNYCGRPEFLIDSSVYPGSSGSPVFLYNPQNIFLGQDLNMAKHLPRLVGILSSVHVHKTYGEMKSIPIPTLYKEVPFIQIPNNLGIVIKSTELDKFIPVIDKIIKEAESKLSK